jgi:hypothetical protein
LVTRLNGLSGLRTASLAARISWGSGVPCAAQAALASNRPDIIIFIFNIRLSYT